MLAGNALRHQMILPEQQAVYDYWRSKCKAGALPCRADIDPSDLAEYLPTISLLEMASNGDDKQFNFRLAGTGLYDIYGQEITGSPLQSLPIGSRRAYWQRILERVASRGRPSAGAVRSAISGKTHMAQFWVRLPLAPNGRDVTMILGFDKFVKLSDVAVSAPADSKISA